MTIENEKVVSYFEEKWLDTVLPEAMKLTSQMIFDGRSEEEAISAAKAVAKAALEVGRELFNQEKVNQKNL